jgi:hypothetical protein
MTPVLGIIASSNQQGRGVAVGSYDALATVTLSANASSITFAGIPIGYQHLQIRLIGRSNTVSEAGCRIRFNGDSSASYTAHRMAGNGSVAYAQAQTADTFIGNYGIAGGNLAANIFGANVIDILDYRSITKNKTVRWLSGLDYNGAGTVALFSGAYLNATNPITSIYMETDTQFVANSSFALYGIK